VCAFIPLITVFTLGSEWSTDGTSVSPCTNMQILQLTIRAGASVDGHFPHARVYLFFFYFFFFFLGGFAVHTHPHVEESIQWSSLACRYSRHKSERSAVASPSSVSSSFERKSALRTLALAPFSAVFIFFCAHLRSSPTF